jgi:DNA repair protein RadC
MECTAQFISQFKVVKSQTYLPLQVISSSRDAEGVFRELFGDSIGVYESFYVLYLSRANITTGYAKISQGGISGTVVDNRLICKMAVDTLCSSVIIAHNHPSGGLKPSTADKEITSKLKQALNLFDINLVDHLIFTESGSFSFADEGLII